MSEISILLAEDNEDHRVLLLRALERGRRRLRVTTVNSGAEFLREATGGQFDCMILDYNLPDYRAPELLEKSREARGGCPAVVISSSEEQQVVIQSLRSGGVDFVPKMEAMRGGLLWGRVEACILEARRRVLDRRRHERRERHLAEISETDPLTGLGNRRYLQRCLSERRWENDRRGTAGCVILDIDHFKAVNDTYGHQVGDEVIRRVAGVLESLSRPGDTAVRYGGEEFLLIRPSNSFSELWYWAERIRERVGREAVMVGQVPVRVTVSAGLVARQSESVGKVMIQRADEALYEAKRRGRDQVCSWEMSQIGKRLSLVGERGAPEDRLRSFLSECRGLLGPTQWEHVTDHSEEVSRLAGRIAGLMCLDGDTARRVRLAGLLHDIGKCYIPEPLLAKPSGLEVDEQRLMSMHAEFGARLVTDLVGDELVAEMVRHHHARFDDGVDQEEPEDGDVSLGARIICTADALIAMVTDRSYRLGMSTDAAKRELWRERGRQFDPEVVDAALWTEPTRVRNAA